MNLQEIMSQIESDDFFAQLAIASDIHLFFRFAKRESVVHSLLTELQNETAQNAVVKRALNLLRQEYDPEYVRPSDVALAIYIWALEFVHSPFASLLATGVSSDTSFWWAKQTAKTVLETRLDTSQDIVNLQMPPKAFPSTYTNTSEATYIGLLIDELDGPIASNRDFSFAAKETDTPPPRILPDELTSLFRLTSLNGVLQKQFI